MNSVKYSENVKRKKKCLKNIHLETPRNVANSSNQSPLSLKGYVKMTFCLSEQTERIL